MGWASTVASMVIVFAMAPWLCLLVVTPSPVVVTPSTAVVVAPAPVVAPIVATIVCPSGYYLGPYGRCLLL